MNATGVGTLSNNAIADNNSTASSTYNFTSDAPTGLTLRNNHIENRNAFNGSANSETGTTTGDPGWSPFGVRMVPNGVSALRDSGVNNPSGQVPTIDFSGAARIINSTIDRGAVEAPAITRMGPALTAISPQSESIIERSGAVDELITVPLQFSVSGGIGAGTTALNCSFNGGLWEGMQNAQQTIQVNGSVTPVYVNLRAQATPYQTYVTCTATRENALPQNFYYQFNVTPSGGDTMFSSSFE